MIKTSLTDFIDFITKSGTSKVSKVKSIFNRPDYQPAFDFYKNIREEFTAFVKEGRNKEHLTDFLNEQKSSKHPRFQKLINGYLKFLKKQNAIWFEPPKTSYHYKDLEIKVNPEIGIDLNGEKLIIKLYFKELPLKKNEAKVALWVMENNLCTGIFTGFKCAILDIERSKLYYSKLNEPLMKDLLEGEAEIFIKIWNSLLKKSA